MTNPKLGIIGAGVMAEAIFSRLISVGIYSAQEIILSDPQQSRRIYLQDKYKVQTTNDNQQVADVQDVVILAIKPQILAQLEPLNIKSNLLISILAGISLERLTTIFPNQPIVRAMPNTPAIVGSAMTAISPATGVESEQIELAQRIFAAIGQVVELPESSIDAVTGLSGSGPAYVAIMVEALADGGVASGLPRPIAMQLAIQTVLGTAQLLQNNQVHPAILKDQVTSPGGTTIAGVRALENGGFRAAAIEAVLASYHRSQELGKQ